MKKIFSLFLLLLLSLTKTISQNNLRDSLKQKLAFAKEDTAEVNLLFNIAKSYIEFFIGYGSKNHTDSAIKYVQKALLLASNIHYPEGEANGLLILSAYNRVIGNYSQSIALSFKALHIYEQLKDKDGIAGTHGRLLATYRDAGDYKNALLHAFAAKQLVEKQDRKPTNTLKDTTRLPIVLAEIGEIYHYTDALDSAEFYARKSIDQTLLFNNAKWNFPIHLLGKIQVKQGNYNEALENYRIAIPLAVKNGILKDTLDIYNSIADLYYKNGNADSAIYYSKAIIDKWNSISMTKILLTASATLAKAYKLKHNTDSTLKYLELRDALRDSIYSQEKQREFQSIIFTEQLSNQEKQQELQQLKDEIRLYILISCLLALAVIAYILYRSNSNKQKTNVLLRQQKEKVESTLSELKATQSQLIQSEKMASLGELTAGIAHEIQNPLNFVNNFSEVNTELIEDLKGERSRAKGERNEQLEDEILNDLEQNLQKISHHGKRADAIVKGMLQHSRSRTNEKEPTDINKLADEYLRLCYHGLRAKDPFFNATIQTDFDESLEEINIIPQDIGRVLLNLYTNAFYAVSEKKKSPHLRQLAEGEKEYEPVVAVTTKKLNSPSEDGGKIEIRVADNGNGIPQKVVDKIFQPFFTTKPTGQGTGLGLSLSYDIIKAHSGEINVETTEGEGAIFIIQLPTN